MQRLLSRAILFAVLVLSLSSGLVQAAPLQQDDPATLRLSMPSLTNLDPVQVSRFDPHTRDLVENLFIGLTRYNPLTQQAEPMLAKSWSVSDNGLLWTFDLRDDIQWVRYDESAQEVVAVRPVVAGDFVYAVQRACDPLRPSPVTPNLMIIRGCQTVANAFPEVINDLFIAREIAVRATGPTTLEVEILFPSAYFSTLVSTPEFRPLAREAVSDTANWTGADTILSNGPYVLQSADSSGMALTRNPHWPDAFEGNVEQIEIAFSGETTSPSSLISGGQVDMVRLETGDISAARAAASDQFKSSTGQTLVLLGFSYDRALVNVPEIRRALALSIDREALVTQFFPDQALAITQFTPQGVIAAPDFNGLALNLSQAQADYTTAGFPGCAGVPEKLLILVPEEDPIWAQFGQSIVDQWAANLACSPALYEVRTLPRTLLIELSHATYDQEAVTRSHIWMATWSADYPDANAWISDALHCRYGYLKTGRECDAADTLMDQAAVEMDLAKRAELYAEAEEYFFGPNGTFPVIPLYISVSAWLQQPWLTEVNEFGPARYDLWMIDSEAQGGA